MSTLRLRLPKSLRSAFKEPFGPVYTDAEALLADADGPVIAVGDVVTAHLLRAGRTPDVSVIDGRTKRETVSEVTATALESLPDGVEVGNPAAELTGELLAALRDALAAAEPQVVDVDGEEDLATLPLVVMAEPGTSVVYGQPDEGMVLVRVTPDAREEMRDLLAQFDGDVDDALALLAAATDESEPESS
jgi:uncharacterized protein (UPF0218 family)